MSSLVTAISAPGLTVSAPWYLKPLITIFAVSAGEEPGPEREGSAVAGGADGNSCVSVGAAVALGTGHARVPAAGQDQRAAAAARPSMLPVLVVAFMGEPFVGRPVRGL